MDIPQTESADDISRESVFPNCMLQAGFFRKLVSDYGGLSFAKEL